MSLNKDTLTHPYMWTASGKRWMVDGLKPEMIDMQSIAYGLAKECRFGGQIEGFYSVARHCLIMRKALSRILIRPLWIYPLIHDAAEGYTRDMCKPVKVRLPDYTALEDRVMETILEKYGLHASIPDVVKEYDTRIVLDEAITLFKHTPTWIQDFADVGIQPLGIEISSHHTWQEDLAEFQQVFRQDLQAYHDAKMCGWVK